MATDPNTVVASTPLVLSDLSTVSTLVVRKEDGSYDVDALYKKAATFEIVNGFTVAEVFNPDTKIYSPFPTTWRNDIAAIKSKLKDTHIQTLKQSVKTEFDRIRDSSDAETFGKFVAAATTLLKLFTRLYTIVIVQETFIQQKTKKSVSDLRQKILDVSSILFTLDATKDLSSA